MTRLPDDVCRCLDSSCYERESCRRWLERDGGGRQVSSSASLFPYGVPRDGFCPLRIPVERGDPA